MLDSVTINQLRTFVAICEETSFTGAARRLRRAQSAVSHAVAALESALDLELFERGARRATLTAAGRSLLPDARAVIAHTEEMKNRAKSIVVEGVPTLSIAVDTYFPRMRLVNCLRTLQRELPTAEISLRMTTMQGGEALVLSGKCSMAITIADVPELKTSAIDRYELCETPMVTVCAPTHPLARIKPSVSREAFARHVQLVVTDNQPDAEKTQHGVAGEHQWLVDDLGAKRDLLLAGLGWGHMPLHLVAEDLAEQRLLKLRRRAWNLGMMVFVLSRMRGSQLSPIEERAVQLLTHRTEDDAARKPVKKHPARRKRVARASHVRRRNTG